MSQEMFLADVAVQPHAPDAFALRFADPIRVKQTLRRLYGKQLIVTLDVFRKTRSLGQNSRYWKLYVPTARDILSVGRIIQLSKEQTHAVLAGAFVGHDETPLGLVYKSTRNLDTKQFAHFSDEVEKWIWENESRLDGVEEYEAS
jgi:hypothetical protein